jgi:prepilin-type N-terminal cleavage/methylation domain-containing protein
MTRPSRRRAGFTLVELLVVVAIIALISATALFAMWGATEQAKAERTRTLIAKIDMAIMRQWETYETRRINVNPGGASRRHRAFSRLAAIRELQRMELPERRADLMVPAQIPGTFRAVGQRTLEGPALWHAYRRRAGAILGVDTSTGEH